LCGSLFLNNATVNFGSTVLQASAVAPAGTDCQTLSPAANQPTDQVTVQVPASALTAVAEIPVTIQNPGSGPSNDIPYYVGMNVYFDESSDVVWDSKNNLLYISKPSTAQRSQNTIVALSPSAGLNDTAAKWIYSCPSGSNPDRLALSADGKYLYVGLDGTHQVQQLTITGGATPPTLSATISLGSGSSGAYYAMDIAVHPTSNSTIAVARGVDPAVSGLGTLALGGVAIFDGATQRPNTVAWSSANPVFLDTLQWSVDGSAIYAANNENSTGDLYTLNVSASGVALAANGDSRGIFTVPNPFIHLDAVSGLLYGDDGSEVDPAIPRFNLSAGVNGIMTPDHAGGKVYFVYQPPDTTKQLEYFVDESDLASLVADASLDLYQVQGIPRHLIRWNNSSDGTSGVAFTTRKISCNFSPCNVGDGRLYVINLPF
jgi:hypothetical protein